MKISKVLSSFTDINIVSSHSSLTLNVSTDLSFAFNYSGSFSTFNDQNNMKLNNATFKADNNSCQMDGIYGKDSNSGKRVKIVASFGNVKLFGK
jgi:hypothetical protein